MALFASQRCNACAAAVIYVDLLHTGSGQVSSCM